MLSMPRKCFPDRTSYAAPLPKSFPFLPNACPSQKGAPKVYFGTLLSFLFSIACSELNLFGVARVTPQSARWPLHNYRSKPCAKTPPINPLDSVHASGLSLIPKNLYRQQSRRGARRQNGRPDRDPHRRQRDPHAIERARMKGHVRNRIDLRIERNQMIVSRDERKRITNAESDQRPGKPDGDSLPQKNLSNLFAARSHGHQHSDIARLVRHHHGKHHENVQSRNKRNQPDENRGDQFFQAQRAEQREVLFYPTAGQKSLAGHLFGLPGNFFRALRIV